MNPNLVSLESVEKLIFIVRGPRDFMFELTSDEARQLRVAVRASRSQSVTLNAEPSRIAGLPSTEPARLARGRNVKYVPYAFTEQGVAMLSSVLRSARAVQVNIEVMRAFVRLRQMLLGHAELAAKLAQLERRYDGQFRVVFEAIRELMTPPAKTVERIGFRSGRKPDDR